MYTINLSLYIYTVESSDQSEMGRVEGNIPLTANYGYYEVFFKSLLIRYNEARLYISDEHLIYFHYRWSRYNDKV